MSGRTAQVGLRHQQRRWRSDCTAHTLLLCATEHCRALMRLKHSKDLKWQGRVTALDKPKTYVRTVVLSWCFPFSAHIFRRRRPDVRPFLRRLTIAVSSHGAPRPCTTFGFGVHTHTNKPPTHGRLSHEPSRLLLPNQQTITTLLMSLPMLGSQSHHPTFTFIEPSWPRLSCNWSRNPRMLAQVESRHHCTSSTAGIEGGNFRRIFCS